MIHAFRLGPVSSTPAPSYAYAAVLPGGKVELRHAATDAAGLQALREALGTHPLACEPALAEAGTKLRLVVAPLPPEALEVRALVAYELAAGIDHGASRPEAIAALLRAAGRFWAGRAWELVAPDEQLHVAFTWGRSVVQGEVSLLAADPGQPRLVLCDEPSPLERLRGLTGEARVEALVAGAGLIVELAREPAWAGAAIGEAFKLPRVPLPERRRAGRAAPVSTQDLLTAAALLECVVAYADQADGSESEATLEVATLRVRARLGPTPPDTAALESWGDEIKLTRVGEGEEAPPPAPAAEPEEPAAPSTPGPSPSVAPAPKAAAPVILDDEAARAIAQKLDPKADVDDLSEEELAAIVKGGAAALEEAPAQAEAEGDDEALSPEALAALLKGGGAGPAEVAAEAEAPAASPAAAVIAPDKDADELSPEELASIMAGGAEAAPAATPPEAAGGAPAAEEAPLSPDELAALLRGGGPSEAPAPPEPPPSAEPAAVAAAAPALPAEPAPPPAPEPAPEPAPVPAAAPAPASASVPVPVPAPAAGPRPASAPASEAPAGTGSTADGWLTRAWRSLGSSLRRPPAAPKPAAAPARPVAKPAPKAAARPPTAARRAPPPPAPPPDPSVPFSAIARALQIAVPVEPPAVPLAEQEAASALARQLAADAGGREHLVAFPAVALQIIEIVHGADADARSVAGFISRDPGLAADVLAVANSAAFRGVSEVGSVREAVARLGLQEVGRVASAVSARALLMPSQGGGVKPSTRLFTRAVAVATAASATALRLRDAHSDQVWLAGLLHDVGIALGASALHRLAAAGGAPAPGPAGARAVEQAHAEIGAAALEAWGLPQYIADVAGRHHDAAPAAGPGLVDLHLVRLTSALARLGEPEVAARAAAEVMQSAKALGFDVHAVRALAADLKAAEQRAAALVR